MDGKQLKNSILQWAIQGKLVPQNPKDEPAQKLLERIAASRNESSLSQPKGTKKSKNQPSRIYRENGVWYEQVGTAESKEISDEIPFEIPENWTWCRVSQVMDVKGGKRIPLGNSWMKTVTKHIYIRVTDMKNGTIIDRDLRYISDDVYEKIKNYTISKNDLYITVAGTIGAVGIVPEKFDNMNLTENADKITNICIDKDFIVKCFNSPFVQSQFKALTNQMAQPKLSIRNVLTTLFPLPPLAEQKRIVAKLEQVLPLTEEYGTAQEQLDKLNKELPEALKKSILQEAIQGKLVPQNPKDESASVLLTKIRKEKEALVKQGKLKKKDLEISPINEEEIPFEIPESWVWCRLDSLGTFVRGNGIKRDETTSKGKPCIRYGEMYTTYKVKFSEVKSFTTPNVFDKCQKFHKNDILMSLTGENKWDIALAAVYQGDEEVALGGDMCRFTPFECNSLYLVYLINSPYGIGYKRETSTGDIIVHTSTSKLGNFLVPLPPLAEQKRIVTKLEQLFKVL